MGSAAPAFFSLHRWLSTHWFRALLTLMVAAAAASAGLQCDRWLAAKVGATPYHSEFIPTPAPNYITGLISIIDHARTEIVISTPHIAPASVLEALKAAEHQRQVRVLIVLSPEDLKPHQGTLGWLQSNSVGAVYADSVSFYGLSLVVDRSYAFVSAVPVAMKADAGRYGGLAQLIRDKGAANVIREQIFTQAKRGTRYR